MKARARNTDPDTSHEAADAVEADGTAATQREAVLKFVRANPGLTSGEIADALKVDRYTPSRRLPELREGGLVVNGKKSRQCRVQGTRCQTWYAKEDDPNVVTFASCRPHNKPENYVEREDGKIYCRVCDAFIGRKPKEGKRQT